MSILGLSPLGPLALCEIPPSEDLSTTNPLWTFLEDPYAELVFVFCVSPLPMSSAAGLFFYPLGQYALSELAPQDLVVPTAEHWSDVGYQTTSTDDPANTYFKPRCINPYNFSASIPFPGTGGFSSASFGNVKLANPDGALDYLASASWNGRTATTYLGGTINPGKPTEYALSFAEFQKLRTVRVESVSWNEGEIDIAVRNPVNRLREPVQQSTYAGTGDYEGADDIKGQYKPVALGKCYKVPGVLVDKDEYIYQFHDANNFGSCTFHTVWDNGIELAFDTDSTDLPSESPGNGFYATDVSRGLVKIGVEPSGTVFADVTGAGGTTISSIMRYLASDVGGFEDPAEIDAVAFNDYGDYTAGYWCGTAAEYIDQLLSLFADSMDGWWLVDRNSRVSIGEWLRADTQACKLEIEGRENQDTPNIVRTISRVSGPDVVWRYTWKYKKYFTFNFSVDDTVNPEDLSDWGQEYRSIEPYTVTSAKDYHLNARTVERFSLITDESDMQTIADRAIKRDSRLRNIYYITITRNLFRLEPGDVITLFHDRFELDNGKKGTVFQIAEDSVSKVADLGILVNE